MLKSYYLNNSELLRIGSSVSEPPCPDVVTTSETENSSISRIGDIYIFFNL